MATATAPVSEQARDLLATKLRVAANRQPAPVAAIPSAGPTPTSSSSHIDATSPSSSGASSNDAPSPTPEKRTPLPPLRPFRLRKYQRPDPATHTFERPRKRIVSQAALQRFSESDTFEEILDFIGSLNSLVAAKTLPHVANAAATAAAAPISSPAVEAVLGVLDRVEQLVRETPPVENSASRFGNPAFRDLYAKVRAEARALHLSIPGLADYATAAEEHRSTTGADISVADVDAIEEARVYFEESWGNEKRIDYGSGMELNFVCWLLCLVKLGVFDVGADGEALVLRVFWRYVGVMRTVQSTYWLEPAGSHGVWGLDDYHFLPFLWGSGQLRDHKYLRPKAIHDEEIVEEMSRDYMYFACIQFINGIKTASLRWHSPMLDDISGVRSWSKVNEGMLKMYRAEVLLKLPIAQHVFFGSLLAWPSPRSDEEAESERREEEEQERIEAAQSSGEGAEACGHVHAHAHAGAAGGGAAEDTVAGVGAAAAAEGQAAGWGDCCGIPIPSAFAAAQEQQRKLQGSATSAKVQLGPGVRRIPFD